MVNNSDTKVSYQGNGQTTVFPFSFPFIQRDYIKVAIYDSLTDETKNIDSDYYVDTVANAVIYPGYEPGQEPAEALRPPILPATSTITIYRQTDVDQLTNLGEKYPLKDIENMADKLTEIIQEQAETLGRTVKVPIGDPKTPEEKLTDLQNYVKAAADSAADAADSESSAQRAAEAAATSEANAAESERLAGGYADTATDAASRAEDSAISARAYNAPDYDNAKTYQAGDVVTFTDGNSYRALQETTGNEPPNIIYWQRVTDYVGDDFFEVDEYGYIVPMDSPSHSRYWRVDQAGYIVPIEGGDGGYRPDTRSLSAEYLNVTNEGYVKHLRADDIAAQEVDADEMTAEVAAFNTLTANAVNAGMVTADDIIAGTLTADNVTIVFDTVADMIADTSLKAGLTVKTMGYYSVNDGGGAVYIISDNQGDYAEQLSNDLYANLAGDVSHINVKQFGITTGDNNATRNTNIFKNLLTSVESKNYKNLITIYFPAGDYYFNDTITFNFNISLIGDGINKTIIHDLSENVNWFMIINHTVNRLYNFVLSNLGIQGNNQNHSGVIIQSMGWTGLIENVRIRYFKKSGLAAYDVYDTRVDTLEILSCGENDYALRLTAYSNTASTNAWHITGLHIERCRYMLKLGYAMNNQFSCCKFEFNGDECNTDNVNSPILLTTGAMWNSFSQCSFIAISVTAWRSILSNPSFVPAPFITVATNNHDRGTNLIDTCEFVSANDGGIFIKFDDCIVNNCFFDLTYGGTDTIKSVTMTDYLSQLKGCTFKVIVSTEGYKNVVDMQNGFLTDCFFWGYADRQGVTVINSDSIWKTAGQINDTNRYYNINGIKNV